MSDREIRETGLSVTAENMGQMVREFMRPIMETMAEMLKNNTIALNELSQAQSIQNDRLEALEKQIRLQTPVTAKQAAYINEAIRNRARELLTKRGIEDGKAEGKLSRAIRRAVMMRYGVSVIRDIPRHEYNIALEMAGMWNDIMAVKEATKGSDNGRNYKSFKDMDAEKEVSRASDKFCEPDIYADESGGRI